MSNAKVSSSETLKHRCKWESIKKMVLINFTGCSVKLSMKEKLSLSVTVTHKKQMTYVLRGEVIDSEWASVV